MLQEDTGVVTAGWNPINSTANNSITEAQPGIPPTMPPLYETESSEEDKGSEDRAENAAAEAEQLDAQLNNGDDNVGTALNELPPRSGAFLSANYELESPVPLSTTAAQALAADSEFPYVARLVDADSDQLEYDEYFQRTTTGETGESLRLDESIEDSDVRFAYAHHWIAVPAIKLRDGTARSRSRELVYQARFIYRQQGTDDQDDGSEPAVSTAAGSAKSLSQSPPVSPGSSELHAMMEDDRSAFRTQKNEVLSSEDLDSDFSNDSDYGDSPQQVTGSEGSEKSSPLSEEVVNTSGGHGNEQVDAGLQPIEPSSAMDQQATTNSTIAHLQEFTRVAGNDNLLHAQFQGGSSYGSFDYSGNWDAITSVDNVPGENNNRPVPAGSLAVTVPRTLPDCQLYPGFVATYMVPGSTPVAFEHPCAGWLTTLPGKDAKHGKASSILQAAILACTNKEPVRDLTLRHKEKSMGPKSLKSLPVAEHFAFLDGRALRPMQAKAYLFSYTAPIACNRCDREQGSLLECTYIQETGACICCQFMGTAKQCSFATDVETHPVAVEASAKAEAAEQLTTPRRGRKIPATGAPVSPNENTSGGRITRSAGKSTETSAPLAKAGTKRSASFGKSPGPAAKKMAVTGRTVGTLKQTPVPLPIVADLVDLTGGKAVSSDSDVDMTGPEHVSQPPPAQSLREKLAASRAGVSQLFKNTRRDTEERPRGDEFTKWVPSYNINRGEEHSTGGARPPARSTGRVTGLTTGRSGNTLGMSNDWNDMMASIEQHDSEAEDSPSLRRQFPASRPLQATNIHPVASRPLPARSRPVSASPATGTGVTVDSVLALVDSIMDDLHRTEDGLVKLRREIRKLP